MNPEVIYTRTEQGQDDIRARKTDLPPALRVVFFMIDGATPASEILAQVSALGVTQDAFDQLLSLGFIAVPSAHATAAPSAPQAASQPPAVERFFPARQFLNETVVNAVGLRSFFFTLKLERANSLSDLRQLIPDYAKLMEKGAGKLEADVLVRRARELCSDSGAPRR